MKLFKTKIGPFIRHDNSTGKMMRNLFIALIPIILFSFYKNGYIPYQKGYLTTYGMLYPLIFIFTPAITSFITELLYTRIFLHIKGSELFKKTKNSYSIFPGLFLGLVLPINTSISMVIIGAIIACIIGKMLFGGFGNNIFNPALIGCLFVITLYGASISSNGGYMNSFELDTISSATPLSNVKVVGQYADYSELVTPYGTMEDFFIGTIPGAMGETSALLCIVAFIFLTITKTIKWKIPAFYIGTVFILTSILGGINGQGLWYPLFQILSGGLMFGAIFMATDPVTSPTTSIGQILYGISLGVLTVIFRFTSSYPEGVMTSILTLNMLVFIIDKFSTRITFNKKLILIPSIILLLLSSSLFIKSDSKKEFTINSKDVNNTKVTYNASTNGNDGEFTIQVIIDNGVVTDIQVLEIKDTYYSIVKNNNYITTLINNQNNIKEVDTISGATITSSAIKNLVSYIIDDYNNSNLGVKVGDKTPPKKEPIITKTYTIINEETNGDIISYTIETSSLTSKIRIKVDIKEDVITNMEFIQLDDISIYSETDANYLNTIINNNYLQELIDNQNDLENVDTVSSATISSNNIKKSIIELLEDK